jgi:hypothetical protein
VDRSGESARGRRPLSPGVAAGGPRPARGRRGHDATRADQGEHADGRRTDGLGQRCARRADGRTDGLDDREPRAAAAWAASRRCGASPARAPAAPTPATAMQAAPSSTPTAARTDRRRTETVTPATVVAVVRVSVPDAVT